MNRLNIFLEHIYEACSQNDITLQEMLLQAHDMGYSGLECDLWRLDNRTLRSLFSGCGMTAASVYGHYDLAHDAPEVTREKALRHLEASAYFGADKILVIPGFIAPDDDRNAFLIGHALGCRKYARLRVLMASPSPLRTLTT